ncbi:MAG: hypothetical protein ABIT38_24070, partial [Gemmatimonadaceae bacterium]
MQLLRVIALSFTLSAVLCAGSRGAEAQEAKSPRAVQPERPSVATHAGTVAPGYAEVETGVERDHTANASGSWSVPTVLKFGLSRRAQLSIQLPLSGGGGHAFGGG